MNTPRRLPYDANGNLIKYVETDADGDKGTVDVEWKLVYIPFDMTTEELLDFYNGVRF